MVYQMERLELFRGRTTLLRGSLGITALTLILAQNLSDIAVARGNDVLHPWVSCVATKHEGAFRLSLTPKSQGRAESEPSVSRCNQEIFADGEIGTRLRTGSSGHVLQEWEYRVGDCVLRCTLDPLNPVAAEVVAVPTVRKDLDAKTQRESAKPKSALRVGDVVRNLRFEQLLQAPRNAREILADPRGKVVVLDFLGHLVCALRRFISSTSQAWRDNER